MPFWPWQRLSRWRRLTPLCKAKAKVPPGSEVPDRQPTPNSSLSHGGCKQQAPCSATRRQPAAADSGGPDVSRPGGESPPGFRPRTNRPGGGGCLRALERSVSLTAWYPAKRPTRANVIQFRETSPLKALQNSSGSIIPSLPVAISLSVGRHLKCKVDRLSQHRKNRNSTNQEGKGCNGSKKQSLP